MDWGYKCRRPGMEKDILKSTNIPEVCLDLIPYLKAGVGDRFVGRESQPQRATR